MGKIKDYPLDSSLVGDEKLLSSDTDDSTVNITVDQIKTYFDIDGLESGKQDTLVSTVNIKSVNGSTLLGSGNLAVGDALIANPLSQFAATTSSQLAGVMSDETGGGSLVFATSPTLVTPTLGVAIATSINGATITSGVLNGTVTGANTGDQTSIVGITGTKAQFDTAVTDGDFLYVGDESDNSLSETNQLIPNGTQRNITLDDSFGTIFFLNEALTDLMKISDTGVSFNSIAPTSTVTPTDNTHLTNKLYVDSVGGGDMILASAQTSTGKKTFETDATNAGLNIKPFLGNPSTPVEGDIWYRSDIDQFIVQDDLAIRSLLTDTDTQTITDKTISLAFNTLSGTKAQFDTACSDGDFLYVGDADVTAASNIGDNLLVRGDGAVKGIQNSGISVDDSDNMTGVNGLTLVGGQSLTWNTDFKTLNIPTGLGPTLQTGQEFYFIIYNNTGSLIPNGAVVNPIGGFVVGSETLPTVELAQSNTFEKAEGTLFVVTADIANGTVGVGTLIGRVTMDTSSFLVGDNLWLSSTVAGEITNVRPEFPDYSISIGGVIESGVSGVIGVNVTTAVEDTFENYWNGTFRETFAFSITSDGATITGSLEPDNGHPDMTMIFSDGFSMLDTSPAVTITLTAGTDTTPQVNYIYVPQSTKVLTVSTSSWPTTEHIKVAEASLQSASNTQTLGALRNHNLNDHLQDTTTHQGHLGHITTRIRKLNAEWDSGALASLTGTASNNIYISNTSGKVYQLHLHDYPVLDMETGDEIFVVNDSTTPYRDTTNLNDITDHANGDSWANNRWSSIVVWGVANQSGEISHLMCNLSNGDYNNETDAETDVNGYSNYNIPSEFKGVGFLMARFIIQKQSGGSAWTYNSTFVDLRGFIPNNTAGSGSGASGITEFTGLTDTPSSYSGEGGKIPSVNSGETALEFIDIPAEIQVAISDETTALTTGTAKVTFRMPYAMTVTEVRASLTGAGSTSGTTTIDINDGGTTILSTKLTIDQGEKTSETAATPPVISDSALADDAEITVDIDAVTGGADETGGKILIKGTRA